MYSKDAKDIGIRAYLKLKSLRKTSLLLGVSKSTLHRWVANHPMTRTRNDVRKVNKHAFELIETLLKNNPFETPSKISMVIQKELGVLLGRTTVRFWIKKMGFTRKKASRFVCTSKVQEDRLTFARDYSSICDPSRVISIDESSFYFDMKPSYGYCKKSSRLRVPARPGGRSRFSLLLAVANDQVVGWELVKGSIDSLIFSQFIELLNLKGRDTVLLDNASIHTCKLAQESMLARGLTPLFLPAYTPEFQPIEHSFSVIKHNFRQLPTNDNSDHFRDVWTRLKYAISTLTSETLHNQFSVCWDRAKAFMT